MASRQGKAGNMGKIPVATIEHAIPGDNGQSGGPIRRISP